MYLQAPVVARDVSSSLIYLVCEFWRDRADQQAGQPSFLQNDFLMQLSPTYTRLVIQGGRYVRLDGVRVHPDNVTDADLAVGFQRETVNKTNPELIAEVESAVLSYWDRAKRFNYAGDQRQFRSLSEADPDGVLSKVLSFKGGHDYPGL